MGNPVPTYNSPDALKSELTVVFFCRPWARLGQSLP